MAEELSFVSKAMIASTEELTYQGFEVFRLKVRINNLTFYSEDLTAEYMTKKFTKDGMWLNSFDGIQSLEAKNSDEEWEEV